MASTLLSGLRAAYNLDGNSNDSSGNGFNGTNTAISFNASYGKIDQGVAASGSPSGIAIPNGTMGTIGTGDFAISFWYYAAAPTSGRYPGLFASFNNNTNFPGPTIFFDPAGNVNAGDGILFRVIGSNQQKVTSPSASSLYGTWTHIIFQRESGVCKAFYNTTEVLSFSDSTNIGAAAAAYIYSRPDFATQSNNANAYGDIYNVWNRALTSGERAELYNGGAGLQYPFDSFTPSPMMHHMAISGGLM